MTDLRLCSRVGDLVAEESRNYSDDEVASVLISAASQLYVSIGGSEYAARVMYQMADDLATRVLDDHVADSLQRVVEEARVDMTVKELEGRVYALSKSKTMHILDAFYQTVAVALTVLVVMWAVF